MCGCSRAEALLPQCSELCSERSKALLLTAAAATRAKQCKEKVKKHEKKIRKN